MNEQQIRRLIQSELKESQYKVGGVPYHIHNGIDSPKISTGGGVSSLTAGTGISVSGSTGAVTVSNTGITQITAGSNSHSMSTAGSQTIAHGLGVNPKMVMIQSSFSYGQTDIGTCSGSYDGTNSYYSYSTLTSASGSSSWSGGGEIIYLSIYSGSGVYATITTDATNIYLTWTLIGSGISSNANFTWTAFA